MISVRSGGWVLPWAGPPQRNRVLSPLPWAADEAPHPTPARQARRPRIASLVTGRWAARLWGTL